MSTRGPAGRLWLTLLVAVVAFGLGVYFGRHIVRRQPSAPAPAVEVSRAPESARREVPAPVEEPGILAEGEPEPVVLPKPESQYLPAQGARIALLIDDLGRSVGEVSTLQQLGIPISYAVLPFEARTAEVVEALHDYGAEILCHLPMGARNGANPGPGALSREMAEDELVSGTREALDRIPGAVGVNNHMGSDLSADSAAMRAVLEVVADRGLFYVDSRTSADSVGYRLAIEVGIPAAERQVFLDSVHETETVREQFRRLLEVSRERGVAIAIGHPSEVTLGVLEEEVPRALAAGYEFVPVSYLLDRTSIQLQ